MCDALYTTSELDHPPPETLLRPKTPLPDGSCTLRRTISYASIDTIRPSSGKGIRRRIYEIADGLKHKSTKKKKKDSSTHNVPESAAHDPASGSKAPLESKAAKRGRKPSAPLRDSSHRSVKESVLANADRLHSGVPSERDSPLMILDCVSDPLVDEPLAKKDEKRSEDGGFSTASLSPGACVAAKGQATFQSPRTPKLGVKDVQLDIRSSESDVTIWDGLQMSVFSFFILTESAD
ncbi:hypothetical protein J3R82DRAFT_73 [Butyriboletus roseoflavus]|nr:hypothetical protein J3R82DRAFT_73 [Butyriboletus roseoflavus]